MHEPLYSQALKKSWHLLWEHKRIWVLGLFAAFLGQMGLFDLFSKVSLAASGSEASSFWSLATPRLFFTDLTGLTMSDSLSAKVWLVSLFLLLVGLGLLWIFVAVASQGALIRVSADYAKNKNLLSLSRAWQEGITYFWPLLWFQILKKFVLCLLGVIVGLATLNVLLGFTVWSFVLFLLVFLLFILVGMVVSFLVIYAAGYVVVENYPWRRALLGAWKLFLDHWLVSIEVGLIVLFLNVVVALVALLGFLLFFLPTLVTWLIAVLTLNSALWWAGLMVGILFSSLFMIFLGALFTIYTTSVWTYLFTKMHHGGFFSRILHWFKK